MKDIIKRRCIWCSKNEDEASFVKIAHTIPQSLGGKNICDNVCDDCNAFFGNYYKGCPSVETVIKETFNISRARFLSTQSGIGKNKPMVRFSSIYFKVDFSKHKIDVKSSYIYQKGFQANIGRQLKKGLYKIFLEEMERQNGDGHNSSYDFIREFARYDLGDYPILYFERMQGCILMSTNWFIEPQLILDNDQKFKYLVNEPGFFEFEFMGHVFSIATSRNWHLTIDNYIKKTLQAKKQFFKGFKFVENFNDVDLTLSVLN